MSGVFALQRERAVFAIIVTLIGALIGALIAAIFGFAGMSFMLCVWLGVIALWCALITFAVVGKILS